MKPRIDRTLLEDPVVKLKFQISVVDLSMRLRKASMLRLPNSSQVWLRIRCRLVIRVLSSLPLTKGIPTLEVRIANVRQHLRP